MTPEQLNEARAEAFEEAAKMAEAKFEDRGWHPLLQSAGRTIAAEIRARATILQEHANG